MRKLKIKNLFTLIKKEGEQPENKIASRILRFFRNEAQYNEENIESEDRNYIQSVLKQSYLASDKLAYIRRLLRENRIQESVEIIKFRTLEAFSRASYKGFNLLTYAIYRNNIPALKTLLKLGLNPDLMDMDGDTPLTYAVERNNWEAVKLLRRYGANIRKSNYYGEYPLELALIEEAEEAVRVGEEDRQISPILRYLLATKENSPLHVNCCFINSATHGHPRLVELFLQNGANPFLIPQAAPEYIGNIFAIEHMLSSIEVVRVYRNKRIRSYRLLYFYAVEESPSCTYPYFSMPLLSELGIECSHLFNFNSLEHFMALRDELFCRIVHAEFVFDRTKTHSLRECRVLLNRFNQFYLTHIPIFNGICKGLCFPQLPSELNQLIWSFVLEPTEFHHPLRTIGANYTISLDEENDLAILCY